MYGRRTPPSKTASTKSPGVASSGPRNYWQRSHLSEPMPVVSCHRTITSTRLMDCSCMEKTPTRKWKVPIYSIGLYTNKRQGSEVVPPGAEIPWRVAGRQGKTLEIQAKKRQKRVCRGRKRGRHGWQVRQNIGDASNTVRHDCCSPRGLTELKTTIVLKALEWG
jgi:hypothetical protein